MIIDDFRHEVGGSLQRIAARVTCEDSSIEGKDIFYKLPEEVDLRGEIDHGAFLVACLPLAIRHGERRIRIDAPVCPMLREGVQNAGKWLVQWNHNYRDVPSIEGVTECPAVPMSGPVRSACLLSGGVDSTFTLKRNRLTYSRDDPGYIRHAFFVHGFDIGQRKESKPQAETFDMAFSRLSIIAQKEDVELVPVYTNLRHIDNDSDFWARELHGAALASVGTVATRDPINLFIAADNDVRNLLPWGSHPVLDPNYGSQRVRVIYDGIRFPRLGKVELLSKWPHLINNIRVCTAKVEGKLNCGRCEKCIRTRLELLAVGVDACDAFPSDPLDDQLLLEGVCIMNPYEAAFYSDLVEPLRAKGYFSFGSFIERELSKYQSMQFQGAGAALGSVGGLNAAV